MEMKPRRGDRWVKNFVYLKVKVKVAQSCSIVCEPMDCSLPGSSFHGILQARIVEWVAITLSRGIFPFQQSNLGLRECRQILYHLSHQGSPRWSLITHPEGGCELNSVSCFFGYNIAKVIVSDSVQLSGTLFAIP